MKASTADVAAPTGFTFDDGAAYERLMGRWSALVADPFLAWLDLPAGLDWLDVGCGDGSFAEVVVQRQAPASVLGVDPAPAQLDFARQRPGAVHVNYLRGDAQALPLPAACVDAAVMALVLFFLPDPARGLREMVRVVRPGGCIAAYHWDLAGGGLPLQPVADALRDLGLPSEQPPSAWVATLDQSQALWREAGLLDVQVCAIELQRRFERFEDYWRAACGSPRLQRVLAALPPPAHQRLCEQVRERVRAHIRKCDGAVNGETLVLPARAHAVKGRRARAP